MQDSNAHIQHDELFNYVGFFCQGRLMQDNNAHIQHDELLVMWDSFVRAGNAHTKHDELLIMWLSFVRAGPRQQCSHSAR